MLRERSTPELIRSALDEARLLARAEVLHAKQELREEIAGSKRAGIFLGSAATFALCGLSALFVALGLVLPVSATVGTWIVGVGLLLIALVLGLLGRRALPTRPLART